MKGVVYLGMTFFKNIWCFLNMYAFTSVLHYFTLKVTCGNDCTGFACLWLIVEFFKKVLEASLKSLFDGDDRGFCTKPLNHLSNLLLEYLCASNMYLFVRYWYSCCFSKKKEFIRGNRSNEPR